MQRVLNLELVPSALDLTEGDSGESAVTGVGGQLGVPNCSLDPFVPAAGSCAGG